MKKIFFFFLTAMMLTANAQVSFKVMSYNIRLDVKSDGENWWELRKPRVASLMNFYAADFIGCQEVQHHQLTYLQEQLKKYNYIGVGRDDGKAAGEYSCIFYNKEKFTVVKQSTFWLSPTPDSVSFGWNAACRRVCTYGLFRHNSSKKYCWVFNTHLDHIGDTARIESVKLILQKIKLLKEQLNYAVVFTGDFNSKPTEPAAQYVMSVFRNASNISEQAPYGNMDTWNAFSFDKKPEGCIDYIFISDEKKLKVKKFATITDSYNKKYPSDHFPVFAEMEIRC